MMIIMMMTNVEEDELSSPLFLLIRLYPSDCRDGGDAGDDDDNDYENNGDHDGSDGDDSGDI